MYILLTGVLPFGGNNNKAIIEKILRHNYDTDLLNKKYSACRELIALLLEKRDINKRIRADTALKRKWFQIYKSKEIRVDVYPKIIEQCIANLKKYKTLQKFKKLLWLI